MKAPPQIESQSRVPSPSKRAPAHTCVLERHGTRSGSGQNLQPQLTIGASNDPLELEADHVADQMLGVSTHLGIRKAPLQIRRSAAQPTGHADAAPASVDRVLAGPGSPLDRTLRRERRTSRTRFPSIGTRRPNTNATRRLRLLRGHPSSPLIRSSARVRSAKCLSRVRVHSGEAAEQSARDVNANAYTVGQNIVFGAGRFAPASQTGRRLLAHELAHVLQQSSLPPPRDRETGDLMATARGPEPPRLARTVDASAGILGGRDQRSTGTGVLRR
jgi:Domain of unknown function (DUF4157)